MYHKTTTSGNNNDKARNSNRRFKTNRQSERRKNMNITIPISDHGITPNGVTYNQLSLTEIFNELQNSNVFSKISIPVYTKVANNSNKPNAKYNFNIGYFKSYNEDGTASVVIYDKSINLFDCIEDPVILPRAIVKDETVSYIIGIDIFAREDVDNIKPRARAFDEKE